MPLLWRSIKKVTLINHTRCLLQSDKYIGNGQRKELLLLYLPCSQQ